VVVNAGVGEVRRHERDGSIAADIEELAFAGGVELENGRAELEALRPLGPAAGGVLPPTVKTGAPRAGSQDFSMERILAAESSNRPPQFRRQRRRGEAGLQVDHS